MKAAAFDYVRVDSLAQALRELSKASTGVKPIAGSQSMGPMLNLRLARPSGVVDVSRVDALRSVTAVGDRVRIGAAITHAEIEDGKYALLRNDFMQSVAAGIAYRAIRNRGTIGGSLAHADPAADWPLALAALDAEIELVKADGHRQVRVSEFMLGAFTTLLEEGEIISAVLVPQIDATWRWGYYKLCRKTGEFAHASAAAAFSAQTGLARVVLGALDGPPTALTGLEQVIAKQGPSAATAEVIAAEVAIAMPNADAIDRSMHEAAVQRCLAQVFGATER